METKKIKKICFVVSSELTARAFLADQLGALSSIYDVSLVVNTNNAVFLKEFAIRVKKVLRAPIMRKTSPLKDLYALIFLFKLFRKERFNLVHSVSPKAGLLTMVAGRLAKVPIRIHIFTGQVWITKLGLKRLLLKRLDNLLASLATHILVDSFSQRNFLVKEKIISLDKSWVLANGSISGVDTKQFKPDPYVCSKIRIQENIPEDAIVFLYLGRLCRDKGILDLAQAFSTLCALLSSIHLLIVGPDEENMRPDIIKRCQSNLDRIHFVDYTDFPEHYMASADIFCLPSYREGFGSVIIEAASVGITSIASRIYGITDAVINGNTGFLYDAGNINQLTDKMKRLAENPMLRNEMGKNAQRHSHLNFSKELVTSAVIDFYRAIMK